MNEKERLAWLALAWGAEVGPAGFHRLLTAYGSAQAALQAAEDDLLAGPAHLKPPQAAAIPTLQHTLDVYGSLAEHLASQGVLVALAIDPTYPTILHELSHPPPVVCMRGHILPLDDLALGIVGTRSPSRQGADMAGDMAAAATSENFTIVSGLARGIDTAAHLGALGRNGRTIAVIGNGICRVHPPENEALAEQITQSGAIISELPPHIEPSIPRLMARNRLISLLSRGVIIVETGSTGGSLATAQAALAQKRKLYAVEWQIDREKTVGNRQLLALGAEPIHGPQDIQRICQALRGRRPAKEHPRSPMSPPQLPLF